MCVWRGSASRSDPLTGQPLQHPAHHRRGHGIAEQPVLIVEGHCPAVVVGEPLDAGVLDIGQTAVAFSDLVGARNVCWSSRSAWSEAVDAKDGVTHPGSAALVAQDFNAVDEPIHRTVGRQPAKGRCREVKLLGNGLLQDGGERNPLRCFGETGWFRGEEPSRPSLPPRAGSGCGAWRWFPSRGGRRNYPVRRREDSGDPRPLQGESAPAVRDPDTAASSPTTVLPGRKTRSGFCGNPKCTALRSRHSRA